MLCKVIICLNVVILLLNIIWNLIWWQAVNIEKQSELSSDLSGMQPLLMIFIFALLKFLSPDVSSSPEITVKISWKYRVEKTENKNHCCYFNLMKIKQLRNMIHRTHKKVFFQLGICQRPLGKPFRGLHTRAERTQTW